MPPVAGITVLALTAAAKAEHASVTRMVQHRSRTMMFELPPQNLAFARAALNSSREAQLQAAELLDRGGGRADAAERHEEHPQSLLHLLIRIGNHPIGAVICDPITAADVYVHGQAVGLPKWQGWAKAARQKLNAIVEEPRRSRGTMRRAMSSPSTAPTGGSASTRTTSGASSASTNRTASVADAEVTNETAPERPVVSIAAVSTPVTEGAAAAFVLRRTGAGTAEMTVTVSVGQAGSVLDGVGPSSATFASGASEARLTVATANDALDEADARVSASLVAGEGYEVDAENASAGVDVFDDDAAAQAATVELWSTTLTWTDLGNNWFGGFADGFSNPGWSEDGQAFRIWYISYDAGARTLLMAHDGSGGLIGEPGELSLHVGGHEVGAGEALTAFAGARVGRVGGVDAQWSVGEEVTVRLTRASGDAVQAPAVSCVLGGRCASERGVGRAAAVPGGVQTVLSRRSDRVGAPETGNVRPRHQEDMAQALGYPCALKYDAGWRTEPRWRECHRLLSARAKDPDAEHRRLTQILAATWLIGHSDLHRRNLGFVHAKVGTTASITIAPLYDVSSARGLKNIDQTASRAIRLRVTTAQELLQRTIAHPILRPLFTASCRTQPLNA